VPSPEDDAFWSHFWMAKLANMGHVFNFQMSKISSTNAQ
jgi:hypothetical protein